MSEQSLDRKRATQVIYSFDHSMTGSIGFISINKDLYLSIWFAIETIDIFNSIEGLDIFQ
jgi:hypothetical protein